MPVPTISLTKAGGLSARADQEQYYLLFVLPNILKDLQNKIAANEAPPNANAKTIKEHFDRWNYRFIMAKPSVGYGNSSMFRLFSNTKDLPLLNKLPPSIMSAIVPSVRLFKIFYRGENNPETYFKIPFDTHTNDQNIENIILAHKGTTTNVNIESFTYNYIATNPAEAENCLTANLVLKFQSIDALLAEYGIGQDGNLSTPEMSTTLRQPQRDGQKIFRFSDLFNTEKRTLNDGRFNNLYYRIKAEVRYKADKETLKNINDSFFNTDEKIDALANALEDTTCVLFLYYIGHELKFEQDGRITVNINYRGAIENILMENGADLFLSTAKGRKLADKIKAEENQKIKNLQTIKQANTTSKNCVNTEAPNYKTAIEAEEKRQSDVQKQIDSERGVIQADLLSELLGIGYRNYNGLVGWEYDKDNSIFEINVNDPTLISREAGDTDLDHQVVDPSYLAGNRQFGGRQNLSQPTLNLSWIDQTYIDNLVKTSVGTARAQNNDATAENMLSVNSTPDKVQFMFLGDLFYTALGCLQNVGVKFPTTQDPKTKAFTDAIYNDVPRFVFGAITILYPEAYSDILTTAPSSYLDVNMVTVGTRKYTAVNINLAYLPISINFFNKWFLDTVIKQKKIKYPLQIFLNEFIDLIRRCTMFIFENSIGSLLNSRLLGLGVSVDSKLINEAPLAGTVDFDTLIDKKYYFHKSRGGVKIGQDSNLYIYYVQSIPMPSIKASNVGNNEERGIFTFTIGKNAGLIKDIHFQKANIPFMQESRMTQEGELRRGVLRIKYNATITMYGSSLYRPGDILIINPVFLTRFSLGDIQNAVLDELGLGGIYVVTKAETDISSGQHISKITCTFLAYGNGSLPIPEGAVDIANCPPAGG